MKIPREHRKRQPTGRGCTFTSLPHPHRPPRGFGANDFFCGGNNPGTSRHYSRCKERGQTGAGQDFSQGRKRAGESGADITNYTASWYIRDRGDVVNIEYQYVMLYVGLAVVLAVSSPVGVRFSCIYLLAVGCIPQCAPTIHLTPPDSTREISKTF